VKGVLTLESYLRVWGVSLALAAGAFVLCMMLGQGEFGSGRLTFAWPGPDLFQLRLSRLLAAGMVGMALAAAGVTLQALLRNPLADPYVLGISSGSAVGVMAWMVLLSLGGGALARALPAEVLAWGRSVPAVAGAVLTCILVFVLARGRWAGAEVGGGIVQPVTLLLVGVVVSAMNAAVLMVLNALAPHGVKADLATYLLGSISENELTPGLLTAAGIVLAAGYLPVLLSAASLNVGSLSEVEATSLGVNTARLRSLCFICASVMTGAALLLSGPIGFVGLICPHICRRVIGADHRKLLVAAPLVGAAFLMIADSAVRVAVVFNRGQMPVGVVTALCGGPLFLFLLRRGGGGGAR
jgi:iron complex transport system permease protein